MKCTMYYIGFFRVGGCLVYEILMSAFWVGNPNANYCKQGYSSVPNRRACTFINFEKKFPPARPYFGLYVYWFWENIPPARLFHPMWTALFWSARLLILRKNSPLHGLILVCTFIDFEKKIPLHVYFVLHVYSVH